MHCKVNQKLPTSWRLCRGSRFSQGHTTLGRWRAKCRAPNAEVTPFPLLFAHCYDPKDWHAAATKEWLANVIVIACSRYIGWVAKQLPGGWCHLGAESQFVDHSRQGLSAKIVVAESQLEEHVSLAWSLLLRADLAMAKTSRVCLGVAWWDDACKQMPVSCPEPQGCQCISSLHTKWWDTETFVVRQFSEPCSFIVCFRFTVLIATLGHILAFQTRTRLEKPTFKHNGRFLWVSIPAGLARSDWQRLGLYRPREQAQALSWSSWMSNLCRESEHDFPRVGVC